jgi:hypothetical protein
LTNADFRPAVSARFRLRAMKERVTSPIPIKAPRCGLWHLRDENGDVRLREIRVYEATVWRQEALECGDEVPDAEIVEAGRNRQTECSCSERVGADGRGAGHAKRALPSSNT